MAFFFHQSTFLQWFSSSIAMIDISLRATNIITWNLCTISNLTASLSAQKNYWNSTNRQGDQFIIYCSIQKDILRVSSKDEAFHGISQPLPRIYGVDRLVGRCFFAWIQKSPRTFWLPYALLTIMNHTHIFNTSISIFGCMTYTNSIILSMSIIIIKINKIKWTIIYRFGIFES